MSNFKGMRMAGTAVAIAALAACADSPIAPGTALQPSAPNMATVGGTPPNTIAALEGEVWVCKAANAGAPADAFGFTYSATGKGTNSPPLAGDVFSLMPGECAILYDLTSAGGQLYDVTVTEGAMPSAEWAFGSVAETFAAPGPAPIINGQSITSTFSNDRGVVITFTNTYTPPPPPTGCTYTQGYWKTHSQSGPAPYDAGWQNLGALEEDTPFFLSGQTWLEAFNTPVAGNQYYSLAHQYMAAKLNVLNGAGTTPEVIAAIADAEALFALYTPAQIAALKGSTAPRPTFVSLAGILGSYNEGLTGPGHCN